MKKKIVKHLKEDIKGYKKEADEDRELIKELRSGKGKKGCCEDCKGKKRAPRKRVRDEKKAGRLKRR